MSDHSPNQPHGPLEGVRVLDFSGFIAGCYAAQLLGEFGASVVKVEHVTGDGARHWGPFLRGESSFFQNWNRNKRGIAVDLTTDLGRSVIHKLAKDADVVVENFRLGVTDRLGISYNALSAENDRLIYCSITGFGVEGPMASRPGYDPILQSFSGAVYNAERYCGTRALNSVAFSDYGAAMLAYGSINAALYHRERTGKGQWIRTSLLQSAMAMQSHMYCEAHAAEPEPPFGIFPYKLFPSKDSLIFIADELTDLLTPILMEKTTADWESMLVPLGFPCGPAQSFEECFAHPQVAAQHMRATVDHTSIGKMDVPGVPVHFGETPGAVHSAAPILGEHTVEVLTEAGFSADEIERMCNSGAIAGNAKRKGSAT